MTLVCGIYKERETSPWLSRSAGRVRNRLALNAAGGGERNDANAPLLLDLSTDLDLS